MNSELITLFFCLNIGTNFADFVPGNAWLPAQTPPNLHPQIIKHLFNLQRIGELLRILPVLIKVQELPYLVLIYLFLRMSRPKAF